MTLTNPGGRAQVIISGASVFTGAAPVAFQNLDLSGVVGAVDCLVLLKVAKTASTAATHYHFRPDTDASTMIYSGCNQAEGLGMIGASALVFLLAVAGVVEWYSNNADAVEVTLVAYTQ